MRIISFSTSLNRIKKQETREEEISDQNSSHNNGLKQNFIVLNLRKTKILFDIVFLLLTNVNNIKTPNSFK